MQRVVLAHTILCLGCATSPTTRESSPLNGGTVIKNVRVFDGEKSEVGLTVVINDQRLVRIGTEMPIPPGATVIDGQGKTLLPGFIDAHAHIWEAAHGELELLVKAGLSPTAALAAATSVPADAFRLGDRGRIREGLRADLLLVEGDPSTDILATRNIVAVWRNGSRVDRDKYIAQVNEARAAASRKTLALPPPGSESGLVSDFEGLQATAAFGRWEVSTDAISGGTSRAEFKVIKGGASRSQGALEVAGEVKAGATFPWAGVMFSPGERTMAPTNLSSKKKISFSAKGDGAQYQILFFSESHGYRPATRPFIAGAEWKLHSFSLADFDGMDGHDLMGVAFTAGPQPGKFRFQLDELRFE